MLNVNKASFWRDACPDLWAKLNPKMFKGVESFADYGLIYAIYMEAGWVAESRQVEALSDSERAGLQNTLMGIEIGMPFGHPILFVSKPLLDAALMSDINFTIERPKLPFPHFSLVLPKNAIKHDDGYIAYIQVTHYTPQHGYVVDGDKPFVDSIVLTVTCSGGGTFAHLMHDCTWNPDYTSWFRSIDGEVVDSPDRHDLLKTAATIFFNVLFAMAAKPEYVEPGKRISTHKKSRSEIWTPNIIGRKYATKRELATETGTHASPRMHWRRGHFRQHACGIGRAEHKVIWIEPMLISAKVMEATAGH